MEIRIFSLNYTWKRFSFFSIQKVGMRGKNGILGLIKAIKPRQTLGNA